MSYVTFLIDWNLQEHDEKDPTIKFLKERCNIGVDWRNKPFYVIKTILLEHLREFVGMKISKVMFDKKIKKLGFLAEQRYFRDENGINQRKWCYIGVRLLNEMELKEK